MIHVGDRFSNLTVLQKLLSIKIGNRKYSQWLCKCDCGNTKIVPSCYLRNGHITSCGCNRIFNIVNNRYGRLTVLKLYRKVTQPSGQIRTLWLCRCDCGMTTVVSLGNLRSGHIISCGCMKTSAQLAVIIHTLKLKNIQYLKLYMFEDCLSNKGWKLRFDFALFNNNKLIALLLYQGSQHFVLTLLLPEYGKLQRELTDEIKSNYCKTNNIPLFYITYKQDTLLLLNKILNTLYDNTVPSS